MQKSATIQRRACSTRRKSRTRRGEIGTFILEACSISTLWALGAGDIALAAMSTLLPASVVTLVFCAPGCPGAAGDAQPFVQQFATAAATSAGWRAGRLEA